MNSMKCTLFGILEKELQPLRQDFGIRWIDHHPVEAVRNHLIRGWTSDDQGERPTASLLVRIRPLGPAIESHARSTSLRKGHMVSACAGAESR